MYAGQKALPRAQVSIVRLLLLESGTYNPIFNRPYQSHIDQHTLNEIYNRVDQSGLGRISGSSFAGIASGILIPSATPHTLIPICQGWNERRIRFLMEVNVRLATGSEFTYYFQGYTSHLGVTDTGAVDPSMRFHINSMTRVNRATVQTPFGVQYRDVVTASSQVIDGQALRQLVPAPSYTLRPMDVFSGIQSNYLSAASANHMNPSVYDTRLTVNNESLGSSRANNISTNYLAKVVDSYNVAKTQMDFGQGERDLTAKSYDMVRENMPNENEFLRAIANVQGVLSSSSFTHVDLCKIDPNCVNVTSYVKLGMTQRSALHQAGQTEHWNGSNRETQVATILSNAVPAIMMDALVSKLHFRSTNHDAAGVVNTVIINTMSLTNMDVTPGLEMFKRRLENEVLYDITYGNAELYTLEMNVDLFGETWISVSIGNGPVITYVTPSFCDGLLAPIITQSKDNYFGVVSDLENILNNLPGPGIANSFEMATSI